MSIKRHILCFLVLISSVFSINAIDEVNTQFSLLTVKPRPNKVYTIYGHTALRVKHLDSDTDVVFSWGTFNFNAPNFIYRFMKGDTNYYLELIDFDDFYASYYFNNSTVVEQTLNLNPEEKTALMNMLHKNMKPENIHYLYNFLLDNCTTRVRDLIEKSSKVRYPEQKEDVSYRDLIHSCTEPYPWMTFGIDLILGRDLDSLVNLRQEMFLPEHLMLAIEDTKLSDGRSLVSSTETIMEAEMEDNGNISFFLNSPLISGWVIFAVLLALTIISYKKKRNIAWIFSILFLVAAVGGSIVVFISFFSIHPCTWPNWNILWLHPLQLIAVVGFLLKKNYPVFYWYNIINILLLSILLLAWFLTPQQLNPANIPFVLTLFLGSVYYSRRAIKNNRR